MIIAFLKYYSEVQKAQKVQEVKKTKEPPVKEVPESKAVRDPVVHPGVVIPEAHVSESLG